MAYICSPVLEYQDWMKNRLGHASVPNAHDSWLAHNLIIGPYKYRGRHTTMHTSFWINYRTFCIYDPCILCNVQKNRPIFWGPPFWVDLFKILTTEKFFPLFAYFCRDLLLWQKKWESSLNLNISSRKENKTESLPHHYPHALWRNAKRYDVILHVAYHSFFIQSSHLMLKIVFGEKWLLGKLGYFT